MTRLRIASAAAIMAFLAVPVGMTAWSQDKADPKAAGGDKSELYQQLNLFGDVLERVRRDYVEPVDEKTLIENAINGMLSALDPHSSYMNPKTYKDMQVQTKGEFGGLGIEVTMENGVIKVVSPIDDTPASKAGLQSGGRKASRGEPDDARQAGRSPATRASASAVGNTNTTASNENLSQSSPASAAAMPTPTSPATKPTNRISPSRSLKIAIRPQPSVSSAPISPRRARDAAKTPLPRNRPHRSGIRPNNTNRLRSTPRRNEIDTPFFDQPSLSVNDGRPNLPAGSATVIGCGDDPAVMSTSRPVSSWIRSATESIRAMLRSSAPVTPATRTRIAEIGARRCAAGPRASTATSETPAGLRSSSGRAAAAECNRRGSELVIAGGRPTLVSTLHRQRSATADNKSPTARARERRSPAASQGQNDQRL